jgi:hypothetical protein
MENIEQRIKELEAKVDTIKIQLEKNKPIERVADIIDITSKTLATIVTICIFITSCYFLNKLIPLICYPGILFFIYVGIGIYNILKKYCNKGFKIYEKDLQSVHTENYDLKKSIRNLQQAKKLFEEIKAFQSKLENPSLRLENLINRLVKHYNAGLPIGNKIYPYTSTFYTTELDSIDRDFIGIKVQIDNEAKRSLYLKERQDERKISNQNSLNERKSISTQKSQSIKSFTKADERKAELKERNGVTKSDYLLNNFIETTIKKTNNEIYKNESISYPIEGEVSINPESNKTNETLNKFNQEKPKETKQIEIVPKATVIDNRTKTVPGSIPELDKLKNNPYVKTITQVEETKSAKQNPPANNSNVTPETKKPEVVEVKPKEVLPVINESKTVAKTEKEDASKTVSYTDYVLGKAKKLFSNDKPKPKVTDFEVVENIDSLFKTKEESKAEIAKTNFSYQPESLSGQEYIELAKEKQEIGLCGELYILEYEKKALIKEGRADLAQKISHVAKDKGNYLGFDVLSYDKDGREKYIEVKTSTQSYKSDFILTKNELDKIHLLGNYFIYRLFDFDIQKNEGSLYKVNCETELKDYFILEPISYRVKPRNK